MKDSFEIKATFKVKPDVLYNAWLDSALHSKMTGGKAKCSEEVGGEFTAWDGYISGRNISLTPNLEIVQSWRTSEFGEGDEDSKLVIQLKEVDDCTELTLIHTDIPEGQTGYKKGWAEHYFEPMKAFFRKRN